MLNRKKVERIYKRTGTEGEPEDTRVHSVLLEYGYDVGMRISLNGNAANDLTKMTASELNTFEKKVRHSSRIPYTTRCPSSDPNPFPPKLIVLQLVAAQRDTRREEDAFLKRKWEGVRRVRSSKWVLNVLRYTRTRFILTFAYEPHITTSYNTANMRAWHT